MDLVPKQKGTFTFWKLRLSQNCENKIAIWNSTKNYWAMEVGFSAYLAKLPKSAYLEVFFEKVLQSTFGETQFVFR